MWHPAGRKFYDLKLFPEDSPIELMQDDVLILNCTALVEHNTGVEFKWAYPGQKVQMFSKIESCQLKQNEFDLCKMQAGNDIDL